ncbi:MAG TPA: hypothetical protein VHS13_07880 [Edaphobacter sp.]|nr:hypothetical protein [Edaphobacter sp.]
MDKGPSRMSPAGTGRMVIALVVLGILALLVWRTIDPGKVQQVAWLLLGFFAARVLIGWLRSRKMGNEQTEREGDRLDV